MFISKKELESMRDAITDLNKRVVFLEEKDKVWANMFKNQEQINKELEDKIAKRFISDKYTNDEGEQSSLIEEWMNGAKEGEQADG